MSSFPQPQQMINGGELQTPSWWALAIGIAVAAIPLVHFGAGSDATGGHHGAAAVVENSVESAAGSGTELHSMTESDHTSAPGPHMDHSPHHGGQLGMVGDIHIELVEIGDTIEIHLSDAERHPLPPTHGEVTFDTGISQPLAPFSTFLLAPIDKEAEEVTVRVAADEDADELVEISFLLGH